MPDPLPLLEDRIDTPVGEVILLADTDGNLRAVDFADHEARMHDLLRRQYRRPIEVERRRDPAGLSTALAAYFAGDLARIDDLPVATGGTDFQNRVWTALRRIPCGRTTTYGALAAKIGRPSAIRAVGLANGANPVAVVVPCHRVIGSDGSLTGYGGGLARKRWLLAHEGASAAS
jgi:methylated-DNA-[protein]-cysteine S-methyltransferase